MTSISTEDFTLGVEEEFQLIDAESGELRSRARFVIAGDWAGDIKPELQENTVEVETRVCTRAAEVREELARLRFQAAIAAEAQGLRVVAAGTHPFSHWAGQEFTSAPVYDRLRTEYRRLADSQSIFGMHVHVSVPDGTDRARVMNVARLYLPYLSALTASSPFFLGDDTGYASYRSILWRRWPRTGAPPRFRDEAEFRRLVGWLLDTERIDAPGRIYWDLRPHHLYPTLEFRVADVTPRLSDAVATAALARAIVAAAAEGILREPDIPESLLHPLLGENAWRAARDGLEAELVDLTADAPRTIGVRDAIVRLAEVVEPVAAALGDREAMAELPEVLERGSAATRIRREAERSGGDLGKLALWLARETTLGVGLDRRTEQRHAEVE